MAMELFKRERKFGASMKNVKGRMVRLKAGDEGTRKKMIKVEFEIPITAKIKELLDPRLAALVNLDGGENGPEREFPINKIDPSKQVFPAIVAVYSKQNFGRDAKPIWSHGGADQDLQSSISLKAITIKEDRAVLKMEVDTDFSPKCWDWCGDCLGDGECVLFFKPLQGELFKDQQEEEDGDDDNQDSEEDPRPKSLKEKTAAKESVPA